MPLVVIVYAGLDHSKEAPTPSAAKSKATLPTTTR